MSEFCFQSDNCNEKHRQIRDRIWTRETKQQHQIAMSTPATITTSSDAFIPNTKKVICILGSTCTGKSQLALDICTTFHKINTNDGDDHTNKNNNNNNNNNNIDDDDDMVVGPFELINADAMQVFRGLDIATNKPTESELHDTTVPHHMFSTVEPFPSLSTSISATTISTTSTSTCSHSSHPRHPYTVHDYVSRVDELIREIHERNHIPIIVGGTNYYIKSLFYQCMHDFRKNQWRESDDIGDRDDDVDDDRDGHKDSHSNDYSYQRLKRVMPLVAEKLHPNDRRKIRNALIRFDNKQDNEQKQQQRVTDQDQDQKQEQGQLRYPNSLFIYLSYDVRSELDQRINQRVLDMIQRGLLDELQGFYVQHRSEIESIPVNHRYEYGILQCIGYKEFEPYVTHWYNTCQSEEIERGEENENTASTVALTSSLLDQCTTGLQAATRRYARKQESWYRNTWASRDSPLVHSGILYRFDMSDPLTRRKVSQDAIRTAHEFSNDASISLRETYQVVISSDHGATGGEQQVKPWKKYFCEDCKRECNGELEYRQHLSSRAHKNVRKRLKRKRQHPETQPPNKFVSGAIDQQVDLPAAHQS